MTGRNDKLEVNKELVTAISKEMTEFGAALVTARAYAHADNGLTADKFGTIAARTGVGKTYTELRETLRGILDKASPTVEALASAMATAHERTVAADAEAAARFRRADNDLR
ncbi:hypothetical protein [Kibdelosporangium phytohabitans]|uniref:ESX-1 secretion-associated protein n=1 Tax=Kibdelosporangium phytohabitans TaxID=860235 RepID=A0A0N7F5C4_9PSEU|nr:hypothetical protein [Kibdelosporangium phytohabitans]ALG13839.1 hypothetical protein AOZ06_49470 [Kibdelosporangium phytohabitans]MBE1467232.1 hypothetical protein [Kibdelosporangium phytohabitans]